MPPIIIKGLSVDLADCSAKWKINRTFSYLLQHLAVPVSMVNVLDR